ncbi:MAG: hypothetical protein LUE99_01195 [Bacteroides sp.]|nr:hypothetical protein [Bacteroides sp.]
MYRTGRMTDRCPMLLVHVAYSFKSKVENKWRQKKMFYDPGSSEAGEIKVKN